MTNEISCGRRNGHCECQTLTECFYTVHSHDARLDLTLADMRLEPPAIRDPFKFEMSEDQKAIRLEVQKS